MLVISEPPSYVPEEDTEKKILKAHSYIRMMYEEIVYSLQHLDTGNFNITDVGGWNSAIARQAAAPAEQKAQLALNRIGDLLFTPVNYTPVSGTVAGHLQGIDNALGALSERISALGG
jgi:hypothetical protein